jgi:hypothetical protein
MAAPGPPWGQALRELQSRSSQAIKHLASGGEAAQGHVEVLREVHACAFEAAHELQLAKAQLRACEAAQSSSAGLDERLQSHLRRYQAAVGGLPDGGAQAHLLAAAHLLRLPGMRAEAIARTQLHLVARLREHLSSELADKEADCLKAQCAAVVASAECRAMNDLLRRIADRLPAAVRREVQAHLGRDDVTPPLKVRSSVACAALGCAWLDLHCKWRRLEGRAGLDPARAPAASSCWDGSRAGG